jgi:hypothetical protein
MCGAGAAPLNTRRPHSSEQDDRVMACAIMGSTDAMGATDRDDAKRLLCYPTVLRVARVESDRAVCHGLHNCSPLCTYHKREREEREGGRKHLLAGDDLLCSAQRQTQQRSARLSHSTPDKRSVPRVLDPPEPDWPKRPWQSSWRSAFPLAGPSVLT